MKEIEKTLRVENKRETFRDARARYICMCMCVGGAVGRTHASVCVSLCTCALVRQHPSQRRSDSGFDLIFYLVFMSSWFLLLLIFQFIQWANILFNHLYIYIFFSKRFFIVFRAKWENRVHKNFFRNSIIQSNFLKNFRLLWPEVCLFVLVFVSSFH